MNKLILVLLLTLSITQTQASNLLNNPNEEMAFVNGSPELKPNQFLTANQFLQSYNRKYKLIYQGDGNLVIYLVNGGNLSPLWSSRTNNTAPGKCIMQGDGNLVIYNAANQPIWSTRTGGNANQGVFAKLRNDGNFVVKRPNYQILFQTNTGKPIFYGGSVLYGGQILQKGQRVESDDKKYFLNFQHDGNLVLYKAPNQVLWSAGTHRYNTVLVILLPNGELAAFGRYRNNSTESKGMTKATSKEIDMIKEGFKGAGGENLQIYKVWSSKSGNRYNKNVRLVVGTNGKVEIFAQNRIIWKKP